MSNMNKTAVKLTCGAILLFILLIIVPYLINAKLGIIGTTNDWRNFAAYISDVTAPITAIASVFITFLVYRLSGEKHKSEVYFEKIVENYMELQRNYNTLCSNRTDDELVEMCKTKIRTHIQILRHYLKRFPDISHSVKEFDMALNHIWFEPTNKEYYESLYYEFESFCFYANQDQKRPIKPVKDKKGNLKDIDY